MSPRFIGESISDAIDWTQDTLRTTRPHAERVLFEMFTDKKVTETEQGYMLLEDDVEEVRRRGSRRSPGRASARFRFHAKRADKHSQQHKHSHMSVVQKGASQDSSDLDNAGDDAS